jgi:CelD/BcsL family acetyltransferase involved in cellulose biosynthesis
VVEIELEGEFNFLSAEYRQLFESAGATAFQHPLWLDRLYRKLAPELGAEPLIITARSYLTGRLEMVLPLVRRRHRGLRLIEFADLQVSDYAWPVCQADTLSALAKDRRTSGRIRDLLRPYDIVRIKKIPDDAPPLERLFGASRRTSMGANAHASPLHPCFDDWLTAAMPHSYAGELERKRRRLSRDGELAFERLLDPERIDEALLRLRGWRAERFSQDLLQQERYYDFYREIAVEGAESGFSRTYRLALSDRTIATVWCLHNRRTCMMLISGFDFANYGPRSIGALAYQDLARDCIASGDEVLDFTIGDESYKRLFGARPSPMMMISISGTPLGLVANSVAARAPQREDAPAAAPG